VLSLATLDKERVDIPIFALPGKCQISTSSVGWLRVALYDLTRTPLKCVRVEYVACTHIICALINDEPLARTDGLLMLMRRTSAILTAPNVLTLDSRREVMGAADQSLQLYLVLRANTRAWRFLFLSTCCIKIV
jgi:hypothetical protein